MDDQRIRIIAADDHSVVRAGIKALIADDPEMEWVGEAWDGLSLEEVVASTVCDVLLLDVSMPHFHAATAIARMRKRPAAPRILAISIYEEPEVVLALLAAGADGYLSKNAGPHFGTLLVQAIHTIHRGEKWVEPMLAARLLQTAPPSQPTTPENEAVVEMLQSLTDREREILTLVLEGHDVTAIQARLTIARNTVYRHLHNIYPKLGVSSLPEARLFVKGLSTSQPITEVL